jgi:hypothetical protein
VKRIYRTKILNFLATTGRATLTTLLSALSGLRRLLAGLLVRVLLAAATLLTALILILLIHWKVPVGFVGGTLFNVETPILVPVARRFCVSRGNLTLSVRGLSNFERRNCDQIKAAPPFVCSTAVVGLWTSL